MSSNYRFYINGHRVYPHYEDNTSKNYDLETDQQFHRESLSSDLIFVRDDFDWLDSQTFTTEFILVVNKYNGSTWDLYFTGVFYKTDGKWDEDNRTVIISVNPKDQYTETMSKYDKEYDLIQLGVGKTPLRINKRPLLQVYELGSTIITNYIGNTYWEANTETVITSEDEMSDYYFDLSSVMYRMTVRDAAVELVNGDYVSKNSGLLVEGLGNYKALFNTFTSTAIECSPDAGQTPFRTEGSIWRDSNGYDWKVASHLGTTVLYMIPYYHSQTLPSSGSLTYVYGSVNSQTTFTYSIIAGATNYNYNLLSIKDFNDNVIYVSRFTVTYTYNGILPYLGTKLMYRFDAEGQCTANIEDIKMFSRFILDSDTIEIDSITYNTYDIPLNDISGDNRNYHKCYPLEGAEIDITAGASETPTQYGRMDSGYYYKPYDSVFKYLPVSKSTWELSSIWIRKNTIYSDVEASGRETYILKDSSLLSQVISRLLFEIDPTITHEATTDYSEFLYGTNPLTSTSVRIMLTQKSNILAGEYDRAAQKAPITFFSLMAMLRDTMKLYWIIIDNKFIIEHISWFKNGGSYTTGAGYNADLTALYNSNRKTWGFNTSNYDFDKQDLPERYEFKWMDDVSNIFTGYSIEINSKFVERGKIESINVSEYTTDVDYMLTSATEVNMDGFALFGTVYNATDEIYELPFVDMTIESETYNMQNGYMSWPYLHANFWLHDLPASSININGSNTTALGVKRTKKQVVKYPSDSDPDPLLLIKTYLGDGQIDKLSINLESRMVEATLKYDTE